MVTIETVTAQQIEALRDEAAVADDDEMVDTCRQALRSLNDEPAATGTEAWCLWRVVEAINDAAAQSDES